VPKRIVITICLLFATITAWSQSDSINTKLLEGVVVTATRTEKLLSAVPMPVTLITKKQIQQIGSLRLSDILQEQTGLAIVNNHGQGIQMQGFK
jgi:outer membrane receptor for ferrienterochelin and colicins